MILMNADNYWNFLSGNLLQLTEHVNKTFVKDKGRHWPILAAIYLIALFTLHLFQSINISCVWELSDLECVLLIYSSFVHRCISQNGKSFFLLHFIFNHTWWSSIVLWISVLGLFSLTQFLLPYGVQQIVLSALSKCACSWQFYQFCRLQFFLDVDSSCF